MSIGLNVAGISLGLGKVRIVPEVVVILFGVVVLGLRLSGGCLQVKVTWRQKELAMCSDQR